MNPCDKGCHESQGVRSCDENKNKMSVDNTFVTPRFEQTSFFQVYLT